MTQIVVTKTPHSAEVTWPIHLAGLSPITFGGLWTVVRAVSSMFHTSAAENSCFLKTFSKLSKNLPAFVWLRLVPLLRLVASGFQQDNLLCRFKNPLIQSSPALLFSAQLVGWEQMFAVAY